MRKIKKAGFTFFIGGIVALLMVGGIGLFAKIFLYDTGVVSRGADEQLLRDGFAQLSAARTNYCAGPDILDITTADRLQGSCCSAMDFHRYTEQLEGLQAYSDISIIPANPYDISITHAEQLLEWQKTITLTAEQQAVYDAAVTMSDEQGPCCCQCWRWFAFEGLAKQLIIEYDFGAEQIAGVWDLEDGCGGSGHSVGAHMG